MSEFLFAWATTTTVLATLLAAMLTIQHRRKHSLEQRQLEAFYEVWRYSWGLTGSTEHPLYAEANMRAVEALNAAYVVFNDTDAEQDLKEYRRRPTAVNAENAIMSMGDVCKVSLTPDDIMPFAPGGD